MNLNMILDAHRDTARASFHAVAELYDRARPGYPDAVFDDLAALAKLKPESWLLEIGSGTGHATLPMARRGFRIDCIELGAEMAAVARAKLAAFPNVTVTIADFDTWQNIGQSETRYDLAFSASAYHWLNPATRVQRIAELLAPGGCIDTLGNIHVRGEASKRFYEDAQRIYAEVDPALAEEGIPLPEDIVARDASEWEASKLFHNAQTKIYRWRSELSAEEYVQLADTQSVHRLMAPDVRERLFARLRKLIDEEFDGIAIKENVTLLQLAEKIS